MRNLKAIIISFCLLILSLNTKAQTDPLTDFTNFVGKNYNLPEELKSNCEWMYAIVKVTTNKQNRVVKYVVVNKALEAFKNFNFLIGYQFPKRMKINQHPIVFIFSVDNTEICKPQPGDFMISPYQVADAIAPPYY